MEEDNGTFSSRIGPLLRLVVAEGTALSVHCFADGQASLESVFLSLCMDNGDTDEESRDRSKEHSIDLETIVTREDNIVELANSVAAVSKATPGATLRVKCQQESMCYDLLKWWRLRALLVKNFIRMWRNLGFLVFQFLIPTVQVSSELCH